MVLLRRAGVGSAAFCGIGFIGGGPGPTSTGFHRTALKAGQIRGLIFKSIGQGKGAGRALIRIFYAKVE